MAFPTTSVLDDFNRADLGANWTNVIGTMVISSNQLAASGGEAIAQWNVATYGADCEVYLTLPESGGAGAVYARFDLNNGNGYYLGYSVEGGGIWDILRIDAFTPSSPLVSTTGVLLADGDKFGLEIIGNAIKAYRYVSGAWDPTPVLSTTDSTYTGAGYLLVWLGDTTVRGDDFGGGTVTSGAASLVPQISLKNIMPSLVR